MANDVIKKYSIEIEAITNKADAQIKALEEELNKLGGGNGNAQLKARIDAMGEMINGLKGEIKSSTKEINEQLNNIKTTQLTKDFKEMQTSIETSISSLQQDLGRLKEATDFLKTGNFSNFTDGIGKSFSELSENISKVLGDFKDVSETIRNIKMGTVDVDLISDASIKENKKKIKGITDDTQNLIDGLKSSIDQLRKIKNRKKNNLQDILDLNVEDDFDVTLANKQIKSLVDDIIKSVKKLEKIPTVDLASLFKGINYEEVLNISEELEEQVQEAHKKVKNNMPKNIDTDVRFRIKLDEDVEGSATVDSIVRKVNEVVDAAQKEIKTIYIKTGLASDLSDFDLTEEEKEKLEKYSDNDKLVKALKLKAKVDAKGLKDNVNEVISNLNNELKLPTAKKIEVEVVGKINEETIEESAKEYALEIEDAQYRHKGFSLNGDKISIDPASGVATESTLTEIKNILTQWNATGIPDTQSKEFKEQIKVKANNVRQANDFDKYFRNIYKNTHISDNAKSITAQISNDLSKYKFNMDTREELNKLIKSSILRKGGDKGREFLHDSNYYKKSFTFDGNEYAQFADGKMLLADWQKKLDKLFDASFDPDSRESLFNVNKKIVPVLNEQGEKIKDEEGNILTEEIKIKSALRTRREEINKDNKRLRENLKLNNVELKKDKDGNYDSNAEILAEKNTYTSNEDIYAKARRATYEIKENARDEYNYQVAKKENLEKQKYLMEQIVALESQRDENGALKENEDKLLTQLKTQLEPNAISLSEENRVKYDELKARKEELSNKMKTGISAQELIEFNNIDAQMESLFEKASNLTQYAAEQLATNTETGLSLIDTRINEVDESIHSVIKNAQSEISQVANHFNDYFQQNAIESLADGSLDKKLYKQNRRIRDYYDNIFETDVVKSQAHYDWNSKEIERLKKENSYFEKFITQKEGFKGKVGSSIDYSALSKDDKAIYFRNQQRIKQLQTCNELYAEQNNLVEELLGTNNKLQATEERRVNFAHLNVQESDKIGFEKLLGKKANMEDALNAGRNKDKKPLRIEDKDFIHSLSDTELRDALTSLQTINTALEKKASLTDKEIETLVNRELEKYIQYLKETLEKEEKALVDMEAKGSSQKARNKKQERIDYLSSALANVENPQSTYAAQLNEERENLKKINQEQEELINQAKEKVQIEEYEIEDVKQLWQLQKRLNEESSKLKNLNVEAWQHYTVNPSKMESSMHEADSIGWDQKLNSWELEETTDELNKQIQNFLSAKHAVKEYRSELETLRPRSLKLADGATISPEILDKFIESEEAKKESLDKIFDIQARSHGYNNKDLEKRHKAFRSSLGGQEFDPFDTSLDQVDAYTKKREVLTEMFKTQGDAVQDTANKLLDAATKELELREQIKQNVIEQHETAKKIVEERQKELSLSVETQKKHINTEYNSKINANKEKIFDYQNKLKNYKENDKNITEALDKEKQSTIYEYIEYLDEEKILYERANNRLAEIEKDKKDLSLYLNDDRWNDFTKHIHRNDNETDEEFITRTNAHRQKQIEEYNNKISAGQEKHNEALKEESLLLDQINIKKQEYLSQYASKNTDRLNNDSNFIKNIEKEYRALYEKYRISSNQLGAFDENTKELAKQLKTARDKYISETMNYLAGGGDSNAISIDLFKELSKEQLNDAQANLKVKKEQNDVLIEQINDQLQLLESTNQLLEADKKRARTNAATNKKMYQTFHDGMTEDQKRASLGVDLQLLELDRIQKEMKTVDSTSDRYKQLDKDLSSAKQQLQLFRQEAEALNLTLSESTGRMYLGEKNKDVSLIDVPSRQYVEDFDPIKYSTPGMTPERIEEQNRFNDAKYKEYEYHSKIVAEIKEEANEFKRLQKMWHTAGMSNEQAEIAIEIQRTVGGIKNWNKLSEKQKGLLASLYKKAKDLGLELKQDSKIADKAYVKELVNYQDFINNPEQYATNKYLRGMLANPSMQTYDLNYIENYRGATESTLQNIQTILKTGVNVKVVGDKGKGRIKYDDKYLHSRVNIDADKPGYKSPYNANYNSKKSDGSNFESLQKKDKKTYKDWNNLISKAKSEEEKNNLRNQALQTGYFALNKNKNIISLSGKNNKNKTNKEIIDATKEYIKQQKLAIDAEDLFAGKLRKTSEKLDEKAKKTKGASKVTKISTDNNNFMKLQSTLNKENATKEEKQKALDELLSRGYQLGKVSSGTLAGRYFAGKTDKTSIDITKEYAEANGLIIKSQEEIQKKEKETTAVVQDESKKQKDTKTKDAKETTTAVQKESEKQEEIVKQYSAKQLNSYINRSKTDEGKNKWRDIAKAQGFDLDDDLNVINEIASDEDAIQLFIQQINALRIEVQSLTKDIEEAKAAGKDASALEEKRTKLNAMIQNVQSLLPGEQSSATEETKEETQAIEERTNAYREWSDTVKYGIDRMQKARDLHEAGLLPYDPDNGGTQRINRDKLVANQTVTQNALAKGGTWSDFNNASEEYIKSVLEKLGMTSEQFRAQIKAIDTIETTDYWKNISSGGWIRYGTSNESSVEKTTKDLNYKIYAAFENAVNLTKENIADILNRLQKEGFVGQLKTNPSIDTIGETDQIVIHGRNEIDQEIAYNVLKAYANETGKHFSFLDGGFDQRKPKSKSFSTILGEGSIDIDKYLATGKQVTEQFAEGMEDTKPVQDAAKKVADTAEETVKNELDINSPSKVMYYLGLWTGEGFAEGVIDSADSIKNAIRKALAEGKVTEDEVKSLIGWDGKLDDGKSMFKRNTNAGKQAWNSLQGALADEDLFNYQKQAATLSLSKAKQLVKNAGVGVNDNEIKALGEKVGRQWQIAENAVNEYIAKKKEALSSDAKDTSSNKKGAWDFDINTASIDELLRKAKVAERAISNNSKSAEEWKKILPQIRDRIKQIREENLNVLNVTEKITDSEEEAVEILARRLKMQGALDISKNRAINNETGEEKISYSVKDVLGNSAIFDVADDGLILRKAKDVISEEAKELKQFMNEINNMLNDNTVKDIYDFMPELASDTEKDKIYQLRDAYNQLAKVAVSYEQGQKEFTDDQIDSMSKLMQKINEIKATFSGEAINLGKISPEQAKNMQVSLMSIAKETENAALRNVQFSKANREMTYQIKTGDKMLNTYRITVDKYGNAMKELVKSEKYLNPFQKAMDVIKKKFGEVTRYLIASTSIYEVFNFFRRGISVVQEFDKAMTELYKVANDSEEALKAFGKEAYNIASTIGSTGVEIINSASDWEKLGYAIDEASELAKNSALYANVGDMDISTATEHMVSSLKAFNVEAKDSITLVDKFNNIGNNYAITSAGIGEALERSASSLVAAGNDIDQSIALITAGNIVSQDPESVGNAIKVLSLRIRGSKADLEEMGEETDNLASSTSKLREEIKALTGVDIMLDENTYKSTYDIILEISKVWDKLNDVSQATVLEKLAGEMFA